MFLIRPVGRIFYGEKIMTLKELLDSLPDTNYLFLLVVICMSLVEISPIRLNPWHAFGQFIRKFIGISDIWEELMDARRTRILRFDDELMNDVHHRKDLWDSTLIDCDKYEKFCKKHKGYINSVATDSIAHIKETYHELKNKGEWAEK